MACTVLSASTHGFAAGFRHQRSKQMRSYSVTREATFRYPVQLPSTRMVLADAAARPGRGSWRGRKREPDRETDIERAVKRVDFFLLLGVIALFALTVLACVVAR